MSSQNNNYCTFENLSKLCDTWIMDTEMWEGVFKNQSSEINRFFDLIGNNHKKLNLVNIYINTLHYYQYCLDNNLCELESDIQKLEMFVTQYEKCLQPDKTNNDEDVCRVHIYRAAERLFTMLNNLNESLDCAQSCIQKQENSVKNNPVDVVVRTLGTNLSNLGKLETQMYKIENQLNTIESFKEVLLQRFNLTVKSKNVYPKCMQN